MHIVHSLAIGSNCPASHLNFDQGGKRMSKLIKRWPFVAAIALMALIAGGIGDSVSAHVPDDGNTIHACVKKNGDVSILLEGGKKHKDGECKKKDTQLDWSILDTNLDQAGVEGLGFFIGDHTVDTKLTEAQVEGFVTNGIGSIDVNGTITAGPKSPAGINGDVLFVGDDTKLVDINIANTMGLYGLQNAAVANLKLGSSGPVLSGSGGNLGIGISNPGDLLTVKAVANNQGIKLQGARTGVSPTIKFAADAWPFIMARIGIAGGPGEMAGGSAANDLVIRSESNDIRFTVDGGASTNMAITDQGVNIAGNVAIGQGMAGIDRGRILNLTANSPEIIFEERDRPVDGRIWRIGSISSGFKFDTCNDNVSSCTNRLTIERNGSVAINGSLRVNGSEVISSAGQWVGGFPTVTTESVTVSVSGGSNSSQGINCGSGDAISGGYSISDNVYAAENLLITANAPLPNGGTPTGWQIDYVNKGGVSVSLTVYVVCVS
jgi:hypothetical protein